MMDRCPHCQFPLGPQARRCGWCGQDLPRQRFIFAWPRRGGPLTVAATPIDTPTKTMPPPVIAPPGHDTSTALLDPLMVDSFVVKSPHPSGSGSTGSSPYATRHITGRAPDWNPPPPTTTRPMGRDGMWVLLGALVGDWFVFQGQAVWGAGLAAVARLDFAVAAALALWMVAMRGMPSPWHRLLMASIALSILAATCLMLADPTTLLQARRAEDARSYAQAMALYHQAGTTGDVVRVQLAWASTRLAQHDYVGAQAQIEAALAETSGSAQAPARVALGHLLWQWGQALLSNGDRAGTRAKWTEATNRAADTPDGARAAQALAATQRVTGRLTWHGGLPIPGLQVAIVSQWHTSPLPQTGGERLSATTSEDGTFIIDGVRPGIPYALLWEGGQGDYLPADNTGTPMHTLTLLPLEGADLGTIAIDQG